MNGEARRQITRDEEPITCRPADLIPPGLEEARALAAPYMQKAGLDTGRVKPAGAGPPAMDPARAAGGSKTGCPGRVRSRP